MAAAKTPTKPATARPYKPKPKAADAPKKTFARPVSPEQSGIPAGRGPDKPSRPYNKPVFEAVEGKGGVTAAVSVPSVVRVEATADPGKGKRLPPRKPEPPPEPPVGKGMVTAAVMPERQAAVTVSVRAVPLREGEATTPEYVPPSFRWPPQRPAPAAPPPAPPGESGLRALAAAAAAAPITPKT